MNPILLLAALAPLAIAFVGIEADHHQQESAYQTSVQHQVEEAHVRSADADARQLQISVQAR